MMRPKLACAAALVALVALVGCGSEAPDDRSGRADRARPGPSQSAAASATNTPPVVEAITLTPAEPSADDTLRAQVEVSDAEGDRARVEYVWWVNGRRAGEGSSFDPAEAGRGATIEVSVVASDGRSESEPVTASVSLGNSTPRIDSIRFEPSGDWHAGQNVAALPNAVDADGDPLTFEYTWYVNDRRLDEAGPTLDGSEINRGDRVVLTVIASDGYAESDELHTDEIEVSNASPEIVSTPGAIGPDGVFRYQVEASDPDGDRAFMYRLRQSPSGMDLDVLGGQIVWRPIEAHAGVHKIEIEVDDRMGGVATQQFELSVNFDGGAPPASPN